ncbi:TIGR03618 family F420-dependent PPOX class oxidoreductase [Conexibacter sp. S30A1]|uniref:TIGR03618 family F420-dependent PPOX class oxidoreductase n=1 Tax=Conexibacter sp. S30A1 TaxID=2937800 RepID=UPI00200D7C5D|nr:TIGR03618 family F420-dependent PPOX class oxidoreductase [Conexibacter sp. S30A1]
MTDINDEGVRELLAAPNHAVVSTVNPDGSILSTVVWVDFVEGVLAVNSAVGRQWPTNLDRDPRITLLVIDRQDPYHFAEVRGLAKGTDEGALEHIHALAHKYIGRDYPYLSDGERRRKYVIEPQRVRYVKQ